MLAIKPEVPAALRLEMRPKYRRRLLPCEGCQGAVYRILGGWLCGKCFDFTPVEIPHD